MGKDKPPRHVAVAIIYDPSTRQVLMITSRKHPHLWILPKGGIEEGESSGQAAVRESWEEAGSPRDLPPPTDDDRLMMIALEPGTSKRSSVWHIHVIRTSRDKVESVTDWPEKDQRKRSWFSPSDALTKISRWYTDGPVARDDLGGEVIDEKKQSKKGLKGGAMETAFRAFVEREGLEIGTSA